MNQNFTRSFRNICTALSSLSVLCVAGCSQSGTSADLPVSRFAEVPASNANMPCEGMVMSEYGDSPSGYDISKIVDGDIGTSYLTCHSEFYVAFSGYSKSSVIEYTIVASGKDAPKDWVLYGSGNDTDWTELDVRTDQTFSDSEAKTYALDGDSYKSYRLSVKANNGGASTQIAEWSLYAQDVTEIREPLYNLPEMASLIQYSSESSWTYSDETPMGTNYAGLHVTTDADREWLANPDTDIEIPISASGLDSGSYTWSTPTFVLYPGGTPRPADVNQHSIGDCCLCSVLASMAYLCPEFIMNIISSRGNGVYDIAMYDPQGEPVTVSLTTSCIMSNGSIAAVCGKDNIATWSTLLEKAVMKWNVIYQRSTSLGGIGTELVPPLFTGDGGSIAFNPGVLTSAQLKQVVDIMLGNGGFVIGGFNASNVVITPGPYYTVSGHAYTFMYSPEETALFIMRNPWGFAAGSSDGSEDGAMNIYDDGIIPPMIDLRIVEPGAAAAYLADPLLPYTPPQFASNSSWLSQELIRYYDLDLPDMFKNNHFN